MLSHPAVAIAAAPYYHGRLPRDLLILGAVCSSLPDADVGAFGLGIPYEHPLGHRGFTHSILFAVLFSAFVICIGSHGVLDAMTDGGKGIGFLIPFDNRRFFFPFRPIHVAPIGLDAPAAVLASEAKWVWLPSLAVTLIGWVLNKKP